MRWIEWYNEMREAVLWTKLKTGIRCDVCARRCVLHDDENGFRFLSHFLAAFAGRRPLGYQRLNRCRIQVINRDFMARFYQMPGHRLAHDSQSNKTQFCHVILQFLGDNFSPEVFWKSLPLIKEDARDSRDDSQYRPKFSAFRSAPGQKNFLLFNYPFQALEIASILRLFAP